MINRTVASRYSRALFDAALAAGKLEEVDSQFPQLAGYIRESKEFQDFLNHPTIGNGDKKQAVEAMFKDRLSPILTGLLDLLIDKNREAYVELIEEKFHDLVMRHLGQATAKVYTAFPLAEAVRKSLTDALARATGKKILIEEIEDRALIGGVRVRVGDTVMDGSIRSRLDQAAKDLRAAKVH